MKVKIEFEVPTDGDDPDMNGYNIRTIIYELSMRFKQGRIPTKVLDFNGNSIGKIEVEE